MPLFPSLFASKHESKKRVPDDAEPELNGSNTSGDEDFRCYGNSTPPLGNLYDEFDDGPNAENMPPSTAAEVGNQASTVKVGFSNIGTTTSSSLANIGIGIERRQQELKLPFLSYDGQSLERSPPEKMIKMQQGKSKWDVDEPMLQQFFHPEQQKMAFDWDENVGGILMSDEDDHPKMTKSVEAVDIGGSSPKLLQSTLAGVAGNQQSMFGTGNFGTDTAVVGIGTPISHLLNKPLAPWLLANIDSLASSQQKQKNEKKATKFDNIRKAPGMEMDEEKEELEEESEEEEKSEDDVESEEYKTGEEGPGQLKPIEEENGSEEEEESEEVKERRAEREAHENLVKELGDNIRGLQTEKEQTRVQLQQAAEKNAQTEQRLKAAEHRSSQLAQDVTALKLAKQNLEEQLIRERQAAECAKKYSEAVFAQKEARLREKLGKLSGELCAQSLVKIANNRLCNKQHKADLSFREDGRIVTKIGNGYANISAVKPFPISAAADFAGEPDKHRRLFYYEVTVKQIRYYLYVGLCDAVHFPLGDKKCGERRGSFAISSLGTYWEAGKVLKDYGFGGQGFEQGDVLGCGLLVQPAEGQHRLFFTKNGQFFGKPIVLADQLIRGDLYPTISFCAGSSVEANFSGEEEEQQPFRFDLGKGCEELLME